MCQDIELVGTRCGEEGYYINFKGIGSPKGLSLLFWRAKAQLYLSLYPTLKGGVTKRRPQTTDHRRHLAHIRNDDFAFDTGLKIS